MAKTVIIRDPVIESQGYSGLEVPLDELLFRIRNAAFRFWLSEGRHPDAVVLPRQLAIHLTGQAGEVVVGGMMVFPGLTFHGYAPDDDLPVLGNNSSVSSSLFTLL